MTRRDTLRQGLSLAGFLALADWGVPALAQGETDVPFTDYPANFNPGGNGAPRRTFDIRTIDGFLVPKDKFFVTQHFNQPEIDPNAYRLKLSGMVNKPMELSLADLKKMRSTDMVLGYECSGNSPRAPGWYGVANVKWLSEIHLQEDRYVGNYQTRWYRSVVGVGGTGEDADLGTQWMENEITRIHLKSAIARVRKMGAPHQILGFVLNDGTALKTVEVKVDEGPWQKATMDPANTKYSWKLFTYKWEGATPGPHTIVSRVTDADGYVQPTADELKRKKTFLEDNSQFPRKITIS